MSREDQYGPALKRARRAAIKADEHGWVGELGASGFAVEAHARASLAQAEETARLADEQRIANLMTHLQFMVSSEGLMSAADTDECKAVGQEIRERLGLGS